MLEEGADVIAKVLGHLFNGTVVENFSDLEGNKKTSKHKRPEKMWLDFDLFISHYSQVVKIAKQTNDIESSNKKKANIRTKAETDHQIFFQQP